MKFLFAFFAEQATMDLQRGTVHVTHGGPNTLVMGSIPGIPHTGAVVWAVEFEPSETNQQHMMRMDLVDADGRVLKQFEADMFQGPSRFDAYRPVQTFMATPVAGNVTIPAPGDYGFRFHVDGNLLGSSSLYIRRPEQVAGRG